MGHLFLLPIDISFHVAFAYLKCVLVSISQEGEGKAAANRVSVRHYPKCHVTLSLNH